MKGGIDNRVAPTKFKAWLGIGIGLGLEEEGGGRLTFTGSEFE
jgi:hypothetical protein